MVYLIDASALVLFFVKKPANEVMRGKRQIARLITSCPEGSGQTLYVPNFCIAECSKAFSRIFIRPDGVGVDEYRRQVDALLDLVSSKRRNVVKPYELHRKHFVDIEDIFLTDRRLSLRDNEKPLSGLDGLVIAMGRTLMQDHPRVCVVTAEKRMARICQSDSGLFPPAVYINRDEIPGL